MVHHSSVCLSRSLALLLCLLGVLTSSLYGQQQEPEMISRPADTLSVAGSLLEQGRPGYDLSVSPVVSPLYFFSERGSRTDLSLGGAMRRDRGETMIPQLGKQDIDGSVHIESALRQRNRCV